MKQEYIITQFELADDFGLNLANYVVDDNMIPMFIKLAFNKAITRVLTLNDNFKYEKDIELALDNEQELMSAFKKLQFQVCYNLCFLGDTDPLDQNVDAIICGDLRWGKINGFQKQLFRK